LSTSIDIKADEVGLIELTKQFDKPFSTWNQKQLATEESLLSTKSDYIMSVVGVYGVAESAALHAARVVTGQAPELVLNKQKNSKATCAIARSFPLS
jgi:cobalt-precorrin 5A hydrolase